MAKGVIQASILTANGSVAVAGGASVEIRDSATNALRTLYTDRTGSTTTGNPLTADSDGWFQVYADVGRVNITVDDGTTQRTAYNIVVQDSGIEVSTLGTMITEDAADYPLLAGGTDADFTLMPWVGGDPIVEEGSNANGTYTKWASGKLICENSGFVINYASASIISATWTFPEPFVDTNISANINLRNIYGEISNSANNHAIDCVASITTTDCLPQARCSNAGYSSGDSITVDLIAIGRWK